MPYVPASKGSRGMVLKPCSFLVEYLSYHLVLQESLLEWMVNRGICCAGRAARTRRKTYTDNRSNNEA
jgi:hypothetical protein